MMGDQSLTEMSKGTQTAFLHIRRTAVPLPNTSRLAARFGYRQSSNRRVASQHRRAGLPSDCYQRETQPRNAASGGP